MPFNQAQIAALFATAKTQLTTITTDVTTLQNDLAALEATRAALAANGGNAAAEWLRIQIANLGQGYTPYVAAPGGAAQVGPVFAPEPSSPRDLSRLGDRRPVSAFDPSLT
jgi:hypothetical protein